MTSDPSEELLELTGTNTVQRRRPSGLLALIGLAVGLTLLALQAATAGEEIRIGGPFVLCFGCALAPLCLIRLLWIASIRVGPAPDRVVWQVSPAVLTVNVADGEPRNIGWDGVLSAVGGLEQNCPRILVHLSDGESLTICSNHRAGLRRTLAAIEAHVAASPRLG